MNDNPSAPSPAVGLDEAALDRLRALDPDGRTGIVARVLATYETSLQRMLGQLAAARDAGDVAAIGSLAHTLKSSSASVGALALSALCAEAERAVRSSQTDGVIGRVDEMLAAGEQALAAVRAILRH